MFKYYFSLVKDNEIKKKIKEFLKTKKTALLHVKVMSEIDVVDHTQKFLKSTYKF